MFELSVRCGTVFEPTLSWGRMPQVCVMVLGIGCVCWLCAGVCDSFAWSVSLLVLCVGFVHVCVLGLFVRFACWVCVFELCV